MQKGEITILKRTCFYVTGMMLLGLGIALLIKGSIIITPFDAISVGLNKKLGFTVGTWSITVQFFIALLEAIAGKKKIEYRSAMTVLFNGWSIDFWLYVPFKNLVVPQVLLYQGIISAFGILAVGLGISTYIISEFPKSPIDGLMMALMERLNLSIVITRSIIEGSFVIVALMVGGPISIGTLIIPLTLGYLIKFFNGLIYKAFNRISFLIV